jgi:hypothetical protein
MRGRLKSAGQGTGGVARLANARGNGLPIHPARYRRIEQ